MFGNTLRDARIENLENMVEQLREKIYVLDGKTKDFVVGDRLPYPYSLGMHHDTRPVISVRSVVERILDHLGLSLHATEAVPQTITLTKRQKKTA